MEGKKLKVLQIISSSATSGAERHALILSQQLATRGHLVEAVCPAGGWLPEELVEGGVRAHISHMKGKGWGRTMGLILRQVRRSNIDVIHTHLTRAAYFGYLSGILTRRPVVTSVHIANNDPIYRKLARSKNRLVAVSNFVRGMLHGKGVPDRFIDTVYNGTDFADFALSLGDVKGEFGIPDDRRLIGVLGRVCKEKGHIEMLQAMSDISSEHRDAHVMFIGRVEESFRSELDGEIESLGMRDRVTLTHLRHDVPRILDSLTLSAMPSHIETFGVAAIEAMARGKAVVASRVGGLPEVVQDFETGILIDLRPESLAEAVNYLLEHNEERERMGRQGREIVRRKFTVRRMVDRMESVYGRALGYDEYGPLLEESSEAVLA